MMMGYRYDLDTESHSLTGSQQTMLSAWDEFEKVFVLSCSTQICIAQRGMNLKKCSYFKLQRLLRRLSTEIC